jgi:hypothetical protein
MLITEETLTTVMETHFTQSTPAEKEELKKRDKKHLTKTEKKKPSSDLSDEEDESEN